MAQRARRPHCARSLLADDNVEGHLTNPRYAGLLVHRGAVVGPGNWDPIISEDDHRRILAKFAQRKNSGRRLPQRYLLSGMTRCGKCNNTLFSATRGVTRRYECRSGPDHGGCGGLTVVADPVERLVADFVLYRLDTPELVDAMQGRSSADARTRDLSRVVDTETEQLEELANAYAERHISMAEWLTAKKPITQRLEHAQRQLAQVTHSTALIGLVGNGHELGQSWGGLNLDRQNAIVSALVDHVVIAPGGRGATRFNPDRVSVVWRH